MEHIVERHPLEPFIPSGAKLLMLGSFPPPRLRWSMDFYYPNLQNDMWRIFGEVFLSNRKALLTEDGKGFLLNDIQSLLRKQKIAIYDSACEVIRNKNNASDAELDIVKQTDLKNLLSQMPECQSILATGGKSAEIVAEQFGVPELPIGQCRTVTTSDRELHLFRAPSSSRAYPLAFDKKVAAYAQIFLEALR